MKVLYSLLATPVLGGYDPSVAPATTEADNYAKDLEQELASVEAEAVAGGAETFPPEVTVSADYMTRCMAKRRSADGSEDLSMDGHVTVAPNGFELSANIGAFTTGNIPYPIKEELAHAKYQEELGLATLNSLHFKMRVVNDMPSGEGEIEIFLNALGTNIPQICIQDKLTTVIMMAEQSWNAIPPQHQEAIKKEMEQGVDHAHSEMEHLAHIATIWPDYGDDNRKICGLFGRYGPCVSVKGDPATQPLPDKISVATEEGICGLYLANANADPSELAVVGTWGQDPICEGAVTINDFITMNAPQETMQTMGMAAKFATGALRLFKVTTDPRMQKLFAKGPVPASSSMSQIYAFTGGLLVASLAGVMVVKARKPVEDVDAELAGPLTARPLMTDE